MEKGYLQIYTGDGKGKTTASLGLAIRAAGAGKRVFIAQFLKGSEYSEIKALKRFEEIRIEQFGMPGFIKNKAQQADIDIARKGLDKIKDVLSNKECDVLILDEANIALYYELFTVEELWDILENREEHVEIIITGRKPHPFLMEKADLITEMKEIRHYYSKGVQARVGIEK